ncbi:MAG: hypothetical protein K5978_05310 [Campylobacter sp.]|nr:hypothetical protein [Campylobacter sp.]
MREFILYIDTAECGVYEKGYSLFDNTDYDKKQGEKYSFATYCIKNGKFMGFFSSGIFDEDIKVAESDELMGEVCEFEVLKNNKIKGKFEGTFIDALKYIQKHFEG